MNEFYFLRHGATDAHTNKLICGGGLDPPLNSQGRDEARAAAILHERNLAHIQLILHSPLLRAAETARVFSERLSVPRRKHLDLREWHLGKWEGQTSRDVPNLFSRTDDPPEGERRVDFEARIARFFANLGSITSPVLLIAHGGVWHALMKSISVSTEPIPRCVPFRVYTRDHTFAVERLSGPSSSE